MPPPACSPSLQEREKLKDTDPFTVVEYIKASVEILMNMKMEEQAGKQQNNLGKKASRALQPPDDDDLLSVASSSRQKAGGEEDF